MRKVTLGSLEINDTAKKYINEILESNRVSAGKYTKEFEDQLAYYHGCKHGIFCNSGTSALQIALAALKEIHGYKDGDEVIVPATTFIATSNIVIQNGMKPVFVDVDPKTFNIDPRLIEAKITKKTRCIIPVHLFGLSADMRAIMKIAKKHGLQVIEDSCETMFASQHGKRVGSFGDAACFSTYVAHIITGGVGGMVTTSNPDIEALCRSLMAHGRDHIYTNIDADDDPNLLTRMIPRRYRFERVGYSYRATEFEAALALANMNSAPDTIMRRRLLAADLTERLKDCKELQLPFIPRGYNHSFMMYPMVIKNEIDRGSLLMYLEERGIETRYLFPLLSQPIYQKLFPGLEKKYPVSKNLSEKGFFVGMHPGMNFADTAYIADTIREFLNR